MTNYLISFSIYTMAMIGLIFIALFVFKKASTKCFSKKSSTLKIEDSINLSPRKTLYVVSVENQRFLIAADVDRTELISKLDTGKPTNELINLREDKSSDFSSPDGIESLSEFTKKSDFRKGFASNEFSKKEPIMKELARKLSAV